MKKRNLTTLLMVCFLLSVFIIFSGCSDDNPGGNDTPDTTVYIEGRLLLEKADLDGALAFYTDKKSQYPNDPELNFGYALTIFVELFSDSKIKQFAADLGITGLPNSFQNFTNMIHNNTEPNHPFSSESSLYAWTITKSFSDVQDIILNQSILSRVTKALDALTIVKSKQDFAFFFNVTKLVSSLNLTYNSSADVREFDFTEITAYDAALSLLAAGIHIISAHNLDCDFNALKNMFENDGPTIATFYNPFSVSTFATLKPDATIRYANAKAYISRAVASAKAGINFLQNETDDQVNDVFLKMNSSDYNDVTDALNKTETSLNNNYVDYDENSTSDPKVNLSQFFDTPHSIRELGIELDGSGNPVLYNEDHSIAAPTNKGTYYIKVISPTFYGFFETAPSDIGDGYVKAVEGYNGDDGNKWMNVLKMVTPMRPPQAPCYIWTWYSGSYISVYIDFYDSDSVTATNLAIYRSINSGLYSVITNIAIPDQYNYYANFNDSDITSGNTYNYYATAQNAYGESGQSPTSSVSVP